MSKGIRAGGELKRRTDEAEQKQNEKQSSKYRKQTRGSGDWLEAVITPNVLCLHRELREVEDALWCQRRRDPRLRRSSFAFTKKKTHKEMS